MSELKCPFCQQELEIGGVDGILRGCPKCRNLGTEMLWQELSNCPEQMGYIKLDSDSLAKFLKIHPQYNKNGMLNLSSCSVKLQDELERTRKALDVAVDALKYANKCIKGGCVDWETEIDRALNKITALEQRDK